MFVHFYIAFAAVIARTVLARCPNSCNGHGSCGISNVCTCYSQWDGGAADCSARVCPSGTAWADKAYASDAAHQSAECSNAGICDRATGNCKCFAGYTGNACQRSTCPADCSGHGVCSTIGDVSFYDGPDYDPTSQFAGDGFGPAYSNWDKNSVQLCECDAGFFGADCSLVMCPKGDDPLTINQNYRSIKLRVASTGSYELEGKLGLGFMGTKTTITLSDLNPNLCTEELAFKGMFGNVLCSVEKVNWRVYEFTITFYSWPTYPKTNNLFSHDGNPSRYDFFCDLTHVTSLTTCRFSDIEASNIQEYVYCSNRGICDFSAGKCTCHQGYGGPACSNITDLVHYGSNTLPGSQINVNTEDYTSSALEINVAKARASDYNMIEALAAGKAVFYVRGDGAVSIEKLQTLKGGHTISGGGLFIESGGATIAANGMNVFSDDQEHPVLQVSSTHDDALGASYSALRLRTVTSTPSQARAFEVLNGNHRRFAARADGHVIVYYGGMLITGGITINNLGLRVTGGVTTNSGGLRVTTGGVAMTGGLTVSTFGIRNLAGGIQAFGGVSVRSGGVSVIGGITIAHGGMVVITDGLTVNTMGIKVTDGMTIYTRGLTVVTQGATIQSGGLVITTHGLTVNGGGVQITGGLTSYTNGIDASGGFTVNNGGLLVPLSGLTVTAGGLTVTADGISVPNGGLTVDNGGVYITNNGLTVRVSGVAVSDGTTVHSGGLVVALSGLTITDGGVSVTGGGLTVTASGLSIVNDGLSVASGGMKVTAGMTINTDGMVVDAATITAGGLTVAGGATVSTGGLRVAANGLTVTTGGMHVTDTVTIATGGLIVASGLSVQADGFTVLNGLTVSNTGLYISGGLTVADGLVTAANGISVTAGGLTATDGFIVHTGGLTITASGLLVADGGATISAGGLTVPAGGIRVGDGLTLTSGGLVVTDTGLTVSAGGANIAGGVTVGTPGLYVTAGGMTVALGGISVSLGGLTVTDGGLSVDNDGLYVKASGLRVTDGMTVDSGGMFVPTDGMTVYDGGTFYNGVSIYGDVWVSSFVDSFSDRRLKRDIITIDDALAKVNKLNGVYFNWIQDEPNGLQFDEKRHVGVIAQEVQSVLPEVVTSLHEGKYLGVDYASLVPLVIEAVRELDELFQAGKITAEEKARHTEAMFKRIQDDVISLEARLVALETEKSEMLNYVLARPRSNAAGNRNVSN